MPQVEFEIAVPLAALLAAACFTDFRGRRLPNALTLGGAVLGAVLQTAVHGGSGLALAVGGWMIGLACLLPFYLSRGMAAGDVKLMAAVGAFLGPVGAAYACVCTLVAGGLIGFACLGWERLHGGSLEAENAAAASIRAGLRSKIPYAGAIALGTVAVLVLSSPLADNLTAFGINS